MVKRSASGVKPKPAAAKKQTGNGIYTAKSSIPPKRKNDAIAARFAQASKPRKMSKQLQQRVNKIYG